MNKHEAANLLHQKGFSRRLSAKLADVAFINKSSAVFGLALKEALEKAKESSSQSKVRQVMGEFKRGKLHSGVGKKGKKGKKVTSRSQAIAIALSESGLSKN